MTINVVRVRDNADCYKFETNTFIDELKIFIESNLEDLSFKDFVLIILKSYGIIGNTITITLMNVMTRDLKDKNYPIIIRNGIEAALCYIMSHSISKKHPDADLTNIKKIMRDRWTSILREIEDREV